MRPLSGVNTVAMERWRRDPFEGWPAGVVFIFNPEGDFETMFAVEKTRPENRRWPVGSRFQVRLMAYWGKTLYDETHTFEITGDNDDTARCWVGPGIITNPKPKGPPQIGFEYGIDLLGAVLI